MCGIAGFVDFKNLSTVVQLQAMTDTLAHRGPDGAGYELIQHAHCLVGLGHRRLAIIDLSEHGKQPMYFTTSCISFNGEIYNFREIKKELVALGHQFTGESDTEMILHAYAEWGSACVHRFIGMFAFVLYDAKNDTLFAARDRAGVKPLFYSFENDLFLFASELKAFHQHPRFDKRIDRNSVAAFIQYGNVPAPHCIFEGVYKLRPGYCMTLDLKKRELHSMQYWNVYDAYNRPKLRLSFREAQEETERIIQSACEYRMVADVPVGIFLSGGYDSATVTALLQKERSTPLKTFTIGVPDIGLNEAPYAKDIARYLGTDHTEYTCSYQEALDQITQLPYYYDEPFADSSAIPTTLVSRMAREQVTVALSADAGDEVFAGYNRYDYLIRYGKKLNALPGVIRKIAAGTMTYIPSEKIPVLRNKYNFHNRYEKLKGLLKDPSANRMMLSLSRQYTDSELRSLFNENIKDLQTAYTSTELKDDFYTPLAYMMAIDYQTYLPDDILQKVDRASMSVSLEGREPLLDHRIIEFAAQLPDSYKYHAGIKKYILREITHQYIPRSLMDRPKMGFAIPIGKWMQHELRDQVESYLSETRIRQQGLFDWQEIATLKTAFLNGKKEYELKIWYLLMFQLWWEKWMEQ